jgi:hypothetical protein
MAKQIIIKHVQTIVLSTVCPKYIVLDCPASMAKQIIIKHVQTIVLGTVYLKMYGFRLST